MEQKILPISVLIPTMNRPDTLKRTLDSFWTAAFLPSQIVLVDQSQDAAVSSQIQAMAGLCPDGVELTYVYQQQPSLTKARNRALENAKEEILICSDDDVDVFSDTLYQVYSIFQNPKIAMIAGWDDNMPAGQSNMGFLLGTKSYRNRSIGHVTPSMLGRYPERTPGQIETQWAMGYFFAVRKSCIIRWGLCWDERLTGYAYAEDLDFGFGYYRKAKQNGMYCVMDERVHICHMVSQEYRTPSKKQTYMYIMNRTYLRKKHRMGFRGIAAMCWCDLWKLVERVVRKQNPGDFLRAQGYALKHRKQIERGILKYPE